MNISLLTVFPQLYDAFLQTSLMGRALKSDIIKCHIDSYFSFVKPKERIDAPTFGPGPGMLIRPDVVEKFVTAQQEKWGPAVKVFFSPQGKKLDQALLQVLVQKAQQTNHLMLIASRYEGMDARVEEEYADVTISLGDFVIMAGDLPAMVVLEGIVRLLPGVVGNKESIQKESFSGPFVDYPEYTVPVVWKGREVPDIIRSGNHEKIEQWRQEQAAQKTVVHHFDWLRSYDLQEHQKELAQRYMPPHYCVLMHDQVMLPGKTIGTTSVTSLDIHDIARSACTYGLKHYFIVTPLIDQQNIVKTLLEFWQTDVGIEYNKHRHRAISTVSVVDSLDDVITAIQNYEQKDPLLIGTSARMQESSIPLITYNDQEIVWQQHKPILFIFGTGHGLADSVIQRCDYIVAPVEGFTDFNHLSVRSAAAIIFDRWMGLQPKNINRNKN